MVSDEDRVGMWLCVSYWFTTMNVLNEQYLGKLN